MPKLAVQLCVLVPCVDGDEAVLARVCAAIAGAPGHASGQLIGLRASAEALLSGDAHRWIVIHDPASTPDVALWIRLLEAAAAAMAAGRRAVVLTDPNAVDAADGLASANLAFVSATRADLWRDLVESAPLIERWPDWLQARAVWEVALAEEAFDTVRTPEAARPLVAEPGRAFWLSREAYASLLDVGLLVPLGRAAGAAKVPDWLQRAVLVRLAFYFVVDARERAPTAHVNGQLAEGLFRRVGAVMQHIGTEALSWLGGQGIESHAVHALRACQGGAYVSEPWVDAYDSVHGWARVNYWCIGAVPQEAWTIDSVEARPAHAKFRGCNYFGRLLFRQRIAWIGQPGKHSLALALDGTRTSLALRRPPTRLGPAGHPSGVLTELATDRLAQELPPDRREGRTVERRGWRGLKARLMIRLSQLPGIRHRFRDAWAIADRDVDADDSGEHFYRWLKRHHPEVNAWYLLERSSPDWARLEAEGVRLMAPGILRKCLLLNARHVVATHTHPASGGFDASLYGDWMRWRFTYVPHGVNMNDLSHWLNTQAIDCLAAGSPPEHAYQAGDESGYRYTTRETVYTGLPRHDELVRVAATVPDSERKLVLFMPTWRSSLFDERALASTPAQRIAIAERSEFVVNWRQVLNHPGLRELARQQGLQLGFFAHTNLVPVLQALKLPPEFRVFRTGVDRFQPVIASTAAFVTDYTSVAFELAQLRRAIFYFQPDRERFYGGDHNWRPGYFDYDRDAFGPVARSTDELVAELLRSAQTAFRPDPVFVARMQHALPDADGGASERVYQAIRRMERPVAQAAGGPRAA
jgi:hypothetical protein